MITNALPPFYGSQCILIFFCKDSAIIMTSRVHRTQSVSTVFLPILLPLAKCKLRLPEQVGPLSPAIRAVKYNSEKRASNIALTGRLRRQMII